MKINSKKNKVEEPELMQGQEDEQPQEEARTGLSIAKKIIITLVLAILVLGFLVVFYVQNIEITGNQYCDAVEIADAVQSDSCSINSVFVLVKYNLGFGKKPACIDTIRVSLKSPWTVKVKVREKDIVGYVQGQGKYGYFDKDGLIVMISSELIQGMPVIEGIKVKDFTKYKTLEVEDKEKAVFAAILTLSREIKKFELDIDKIIVHDGELYLMIGNVLVALGTEISPEQIAQIEPILKKLGNQSGILHLENYTEESKHIIFKKKTKDDINAFLNSHKSILGDNAEAQENEKEEEETEESVPDQNVQSQPQDESNQSDGSSQENQENTNQEDEDFVDLDGDGIPDEDFVDLDGDGIPDEDFVDLDGDGIPDEEFTDLDGDGIPDEYSFESYDTGESYDWEAMTWE